VEPLEAGSSEKHGEGTLKYRLGLEENHVFLNQMLDDSEIG